MSDDSSVPPAAAPEPKKGRAVKPLPVYVGKLTDKDLEKFNVTEEYEEGKPMGDNGPYEVAISVTVEEENGPATYSLDSFTSDQLKVICKNVGVKCFSSASKFLMRKLIAHQKKWGMLANIHPLIDSGDKLVKKLNTQLRIINAVSHKDITAPLKKVNDLKDRFDQEHGLMPRQTWQKFADLVNDATPDDELDKILCPNVLDVEVHEDHMKKYDDDAIDPKKFNNVDSKSVADIVAKLFKVREEMKRCMEHTGTHDYDPMRYVDRGIKRSGHKEINRLAAYCFWQKAEEVPDLEDTFKPVIRQVCLL